FSRAAAFSFQSSKLRQDQWVDQNQTNSWPRPMPAKILSCTAKAVVMRRISKRQLHDWRRLSITQALIPPKNSQLQVSAQLRIWQRLRAERQQTVRSKHWFILLLLEAIRNSQESRNLLKTRNQPLFWRFY